MEDQIIFNKKAHDKVCEKYEKKHIEIYNDIEQERLKMALLKAFNEVRTGAEKIKALDFGCGAGNLTKYMLSLDMTVLAADISPKFIELMKRKFSMQDNKKLNFFQLNGKDLSGIDDNSIDFIGTYSVLHHVPDYLGIVREFSRILKPGGVIFIDHEASPEAWNPSEKLINYRKKLKTELFKKNKYIRFGHIFMFSYWVYFVKGLLNSKFRPEGDIHVFQDDHISWDEIGKILNENNVREVVHEDYLLYVKGCSIELFDEFKNNCSNMRLFIGRKLNN